MNTLIYTGLYDTAKRAYLRQVSATEMEKAQDMIIIICNELNVRIEDVESPVRKRDLALARQVCMHFIKHRTKLSLKQIGELLGGRDHSTVIYGLTTYEDIFDSDKRFRALMIELEDILNGKHKE